ncbi:metal ABC transporter substrate-binding protein [Chlamydia trachomatis]|uniref:Putative metal-binding protein TC_0696 n=2 Tax=Chlamydia muridarum TaxID=83560 RepID=Y696_CHLMU|nr:zinc ABC transporter substrate-binding protein [Chlamydia muridarum]Q9PJY0.1 RecName: Full=Putative metal-binding protein TC_0696; Flags: Precursor [Chlamydia muridarum str. Nigg]UFT34923.1 metal ABC transporter substrate-binding protein [Chlamydia trachomatis]AAF39512.1 ABC transporter, periplasmic substrate-binding protein, putative [Chlamydia muridarum str. Nigg]AHH23081.1 metal ABC transporter substrate-binding protein [Chlamydia muridarum str. Nigg3 CMUT3-5]AHH24006.1 metal ABC transpo
MRLLILLLFSFGIIYSHGDEIPTQKQVLVSIVPYKFLVEQISGDTCQVFSIVMGNRDPHNYELPPKYIEKIRQADLWFRIGEGFERTCERIVSCKQVDLAANIDKIMNGSCCQRFLNFDTHTWLSPKNLKIQIESIAEALIAIAPEHADLYRKNCSLLQDQLDLLDQKVSSIVSQSSQRNVLVAHGAFAYFCRDYGFVQHTIERSNHSELSPKDIVRVEQTIRDHNLHSVVLLKHAGKRSSAALVRKFNMTPVLLDPYAEDVFSNLIAIATAFADL